MLTIKSTALGLALAAGLLATTVPARAADDIVDTAAKAGSFNTLVTAVKAAGLVDTLKGKGPFTVFAPTDEGAVADVVEIWMTLSSAFSGYRVMRQRQAFADPS